jgi:hypothetical protein
MNDDGGASGLPHIIAFSPIRQSPSILNLFLEQLRMQSVDVWVYDDNEPGGESSALLDDATVLPRIDLPPTDYGKNEFGHFWSKRAFARVAAIKQYGIDSFLESDATHLFLVDSDVILQPGTVDHLVELDLPVVAAVFWSQWQDERPWMPNVWEWPPYAFSSPQWLEHLRWPGHVEVGGLGACTLIARSVLEQVRIEPTPATEELGEDRWFAARCTEAGIPMTACTCVTPFHVYHPRQLVDAEGWDECKAKIWTTENLDDGWWQRIKAGER